ncbi:hypothetical protein [Microbacterium immunditiarum]|uniref:Cell division protein FtsL n=1 Tax=Microbacterium immunditiarum TaxID=337480 RepID=A0A7Y9KMB7_9MICO|nr:hypothetical protein [Microbacterium immunditiarum]NYE20649.1 hypothetical protein [Microbacterium immunditiarum]
MNAAPSAEILGMTPAAAAVAVAAPLPERQSPGRRLRVVDAPARRRRRRRPKLVYGIVAVVGALAIGAAQMALSILMTQGSYEMSKLTQEQRALTYQKQMLQDDIAGLSSPQFLAANATALGMVIDEAPSYLRLSDGSLLGPGQVSFGSSSIDALGRAAVPNALVEDTPLVTDPDATIEGRTVVETDAATGADDGGGVVNTPPALTDGLPIPETH